MSSRLERKEAEAELSDSDGSFDDDIEQSSENDHDSDFDASFADSVDHTPGRSGEGASAAMFNLREVENQPYDARVDLEDSFSDESINTADNPSPKMRKIASPFPAPGVDDGDTGDSPPHTLTSPGLDQRSLSEVDEIPGSSKKDGEAKNDEKPAKRSNFGVKLDARDEEMQDAAKRAAERNRMTAQKPDDDDEEEEEDEADDDDESSMSSSTDPKDRFAVFEGFDPRDFDNLNVSKEVKELFQYISRYRPHEIELDTKLRCFIPEYIPAIGEIDAFVKVPRPDNVEDGLGLKLLDEPAANQSDATVLDLQLRAISKKSVRNPMVVRSIENASTNRKSVQGWIDSIKDLHKSKPQPQVHYTKQMPDIEDLMQVWPEEVENLMKQVKIPSSDIDLDLKDYARVVCAILDIPIFNNMTEPLHVLFTLYSEFRNNQHFQQHQQHK